MSSSTPTETSSAIVGPGAIGGAIAGAVIQAGGSPLICARTPFSTLTVDHPAGSTSAPVTCVTDPASASPVDVVILAVKAHQTEAAAAWLHALTGPNTVVVVAQNGVEHRERVGPYLREGAQMVPAVIWCPSQRHGPDHIEVTGPARLVVPEGPGADQLMALVDGSFFEIRATSDWVTKAWDKLLINSAIGGAGVLTGRAGSELASDPTVYEMLLAAMTEAAEVGRAEGASIAPERAKQILDGMASSPIRHLSSISVDRKAGVATEWDARNKVIERLAARHGIDVPLNRWLTALVRMGEPDAT